MLQYLFLLLGDELALVPVLLWVELFFLLGGNFKCSDLSGSLLILLNGIGLLLHQSLYHESQNHAPNRAAIAPVRLRS
jgi:hypothetical protein